MDALLVGDVHIKSVAPKSRTPEYKEQILDKLRFCVSYANAHSLPIVQGGDLFDLKSASKNSHRLVQEVHEVLKHANNGVWFIPGNHDMCVSEDTETLTLRGWKHYWEVEETDSIATLNPVSHSFEWQKLNAVILGNYTGKMKHFTSMSTDHLVTPNHRMYVKSKNWDWQFKKAEEAPNYHYWDAKVSADSWEGVRPDSVHIAPSSRRPGLDIVDVESLSALLGWYVAEGCAEDYRVTICQDRTVNFDNCEEIKLLCKNLNLPTTQSQKYIRINHTPFANFIKANLAGTSYFKHIPAWLKNWPPDLLELFMRAYIAGDGTPNGESYVVTTASDQLVDDLQEVCVKLGWITRATERKNFPVTIVGQDYIGTGRRVGITFKSTKALMGCSDIEYNGVVWCVNVDNHIWLTRRNGKVIWTGNSGDRLESLPSQPLGTLSRMKNMNLLIGETVDLPGIAGIPYITEFDGGDWARALYEYNDFDATEPELIVTHAPIFPTGQEPGVYASITTAAWEKYFGGVFATFYSHIHDNHGVHLSPNEAMQFCNHGALSRGSLHEASVNRKPAVTHWHSDTMTFERIEVPHKPAEEVFLRDIAEIVAQNKVSALEFAEALGSTQLAGLTYESLSAILREEVKDDKVLAVILDVLEEVQ